MNFGHLAKYYFWFVYSFDNQSIHIFDYNKKKSLLMIENIVSR